MLIVAPFVSYLHYTILLSCSNWLHIILSVINRKNGFIFTMHSAFLSRHMLKWFNLTTVMLILAPFKYLALFNFSIWLDNFYNDNDKIGFNS